MEWAEHYAEEPWGFEVEDMRNALNTLVTARAGGAKNAKLDDFRLRGSKRLDTGPDVPLAVKLANQVKSFFKLG